MRARARRRQGAAARRAHRYAQHHQGIRRARPHPGVARRARPGRRSAGARGAGVSRSPRRAARRWTCGSCPPDSGWCSSSRKAERRRCCRPAPTNSASRSSAAPRWSALTQDGDGVTVDCAGGDTVRADYVVGCDGAHSTVRRLLGIDFVGKQYETHILLADVQLARRTGRDVDGRHQREGRGARHPVRRRLVPCDRVGPIARAGAAVRAGDARRDPRLVRPHRRRGLRHDRDALEFTVSQSSDGRHGTIGTAACFWPATPRMCTRRSADRA